MLLYSCTFMGLFVAFWSLFLSSSGATLVVADDKAGESAPVEARGVFVHNKHKTLAVELSLQINEDRPVEYTLKPQTTVLIYEEKSSKNPPYKQKDLWGILRNAAGKQVASGGTQGCEFMLGEKPGIAVHGNAGIKITKGYFKKNAIDGKKFSHLERVEITIKKGIGD
jgi:hypothetical protein